MNPEMNTARLLGAAQLIVFTASMVSEQLLKSVMGAGEMPVSLENISKNLSRIRASNIIALINCLAIIVLGVLFYRAFQKDYQIISMVALVFFIAEAVTLAVSKLGTFALIPLVRDFTSTGEAGASQVQKLGNFLYHGIDRTGYDLHMLFFCAGAVLWYYILFHSKAVPVTISLWGLVAVSLLTIPVLLGLYDRSLTKTMFLGIFYAPYELILGLWLMIKGFS